MSLTGMLQSPRQREEGVLAVSWLPELLLEVTHSTSVYLSFQRQSWPLIKPRSDHTSLSLKRGASFIWLSLMSRRDSLSHISVWVIPSPASMG